MQRKSLFITVLLLALALGLGGNARAQDAVPVGADAALGTAFTYQGQLQGASSPVSGNCDFQFSLWDALTGGAQVGTTQTKTNVALGSGLFTVELDFGASAFAGSARWLAIGVRCPAGSGSYTTLTPRQALTPAPYALYSVNAGTAANLSGVLPVANGGTGSATKNFVDLSSAQTVGGVKTFSSAPSFTASGAPFSVSGTGMVANLNADRLDGKHASSFQQRYQNLIVVAKSGGDYTTITGALNSITAASADNPFTIYVAPGIYSERVVMKSYVDIEGAGELSTKITYIGSSSLFTGTVVGADNAELRFLAVENTGGADEAVAIYNGHTSPHLTHVTAAVSGGVGNKGVFNYFSSSMMTNVNVTTSGGTNNYGVFNQVSSATMMNVTTMASGGTWNYGVFNDQSNTLTMMNVTANASGGTNSYGVYNNLASPTMMNVTINVSGGAVNIGVDNYSSSPTMTNLVINVSGGNSDIGIASSSSYTYPTCSPKMTNVKVTAWGGLYSTGVRNDSCSATMTNITISASGGTASYGVRNSSSSPTMTGVTATASGGTTNYGVYNEIDSSPTMIRVTATASGGTSSYGVYNSSSSPTIQDSMISASGASGGSNDGLHNEASSGSYLITINNSQITGSTNTIYQDSHYTTKVGASLLAGGGASGGTYTCVASYNGNHELLDSSTCQYP